MSLDEAAPRGGYTPALLVRHLFLGFSHMRRVVREMQQAGAGWGAFIAISLLVGAGFSLEAIVREPGLLRRGDDQSSLLVALGWPTLLVIVLGLVLAVVWFATCRLFRARVTLRQSLIGVAAGSLPQVALSILVALIALPLAMLLGAERQTDLLYWLDYAIIVALWGYGVVAYAAATGLSLVQSLAVQIVGVVLFGLLLIGGGALVALALDASLSELVQLVLG